EKPWGKTNDCPLGEVVHIPGRAVYEGRFCKELGHLGLKTGNVIIGGPAESRCPVVYVDDIDRKGISPIFQGTYVYGRRAYATFGRSTHVPRQWIGQQQVVGFLDIKIPFQLYPTIEQVEVKANIIR